APPGACGTVCLMARTVVKSNLRGPRGTRRDCEALHGWGGAAGVSWARRPTRPRRADGGPSSAGDPTGGGGRRSTLWSSAAGWRVQPGHREGDIRRGRRGAQEMSGSYDPRDPYRSRRSEHGYGQGRDGGWGGDNDYQDDYEAPRRPSRSSGRSQG